MQFLTTAEAAKKLKVNSSRIRQLIASGSIKAAKHGRDWLIDPAEIDKRLAAKPSPGRPREDYMKLIEIRRRLAGSKSIQKNRKNYDPAKYAILKLARAALDSLLKEAREIGKTDSWNKAARQAIRDHDNAMINLIGIPMLHAGRPMHPGR